MNLVLIGYRGTGKTVIGKLLATELEMPYVGLDDAIVDRAGKPIPEIVSQQGWDAFRDLEAQIVDEVAAGDRQVLDTGGGVITRATNTARLRRNGLVVLLEATLDDIVARIGGDTQRPSLTGTKSFTEEVAQVLGERQPLYRAAADHRVDTSELAPADAACHIAAIFRRRTPDQKP
jgi:shikimate kinase